MSARDELAGLVNRADWTARSQTIADAIFAAGWRPPTKTLGYLVVDREGDLLGKRFMNLEAAQAFADEWTADCKTAGIDWDYRVVEITEPK